MIKSKEIKQNTKQLKFHREQDFEIFRLSEVFQEAKNLISDLQDKKIADTNIQKIQYSKNRLKIISEFVLKRLKSKQKMDIKKFVGLTSLLSFLIASSSQKQHHSLNFPLIFYRNFINYTKTLGALYMEQMNQKSIIQKNKIVCIYLFSLSTIIEKQKIDSGLNLQRLFSQGVIKTLLQLKLFDQQKIMRSYRLIILYFYEKRKKSLPISLFVKSLIYHLGICTSNKNTEWTIIYVLNKILKNHDRAHKLILDCELKSVLEKLKQLMIGIQISTEVSRLSFCLFSKFIKARPELAKNLMTGSEVATLIQKLYLNQYHNLVLSFSVIVLLDSLPHSELFVVYKAFCKIQSFSNIHLQVLLHVTQKPNAQIFLDMINQGLVQKLHNYWIGNHTQMRYRELVYHILQNIAITSCEINQEISNALKLYLLPSQQTKFK